MTVPDGVPGFKVDASATAYFLSGLDLLVCAGLYDLNILEATLGPVQSASLAAVDSQASDKSYASNYKLDLVGKVGLGSSVKAAIKKLLNDDPGDVSFALTISKNLSSSPTGTMTVDKTSAVVGDKVHFDFQLDPA